MKYLSILSLIILIIVISGCIGQNPEPMTSPNDGVVITDFSLESSQIYARDNIGLRLELQNVGGNKATLKKIQLYGVDFKSGSSDENAWGIKGNGLQQLDENFIKTNLPSKGELFQPDPSINFDGAKDFYEWRLQSPSDISSETNYDLRVRIEYDYETTYSADIRIINDEYLLTLSDEDRQKLFNSGGIISSELTNGPISVIPYSGRHFIVSQGESGEKRIIKFKIENVGKGYSYIDDITNGNYYIKINGITGDVITNCNITNPLYPKIKLSSGKSHTIECEFNPPTNIENKVDKPFQIIFAYSYYVDASVSVTVKPLY